MSQNSGVSDPVMNELIQCSGSSNSHWTEETVQLEADEHGVNTTEGIK